MGIEFGSSWVTVGVAGGSDARINIKQSCKSHKKRTVLVLVLLVEL